MTDVERELSALRAQVDRMQHRQRRIFALLGSITLAAAVGAVLASRPAHSDPAAPLACGHASQSYCFNADSPALAAQVNSNFEAAFQAIDTKFDKTGGTFTGNVTLPNLTINGSASFGASGTVTLGLYTRSAAGTGGGATAVCDQFDSVLGGQAVCSNNATLIAAGSTTYGNATTWGYYGTCSTGQQANITAYCLKRARQ